MNTIIPIFMFSMFFIFSFIGIVYTVKNNDKLDKLVTNKKLIKQYRNLKIKDSETLKMSFWSGNLKIYENILVIENGSYFHHINLEKNKKKQPMTISLQQVNIEKNTLILQGIKHRVLGNRHIKIRIRSNIENEIIDINNLIITLLPKV